MILAPSEIYYSQDSISNRFGKSTDHAGQLIGELLDDILTGKCSISKITTIEVVRRNDKFITGDNRRLWVFKKLQELGKCKEIPIFLTSSIDSRKSVIGLTIEVRGDPGGHLWRRWNECASSSTEQISEASESDSQPLLRSFSKTSLSSDVIRCLSPSKLYYSLSRLTCKLSNLKNGIEQICTCQFPFTDVEMKVYLYENKYCAVDNEMLWKLRVAEKFQKCSSVEINIIGMPRGTCDPYWSDELHIYCDESYFFFDFRQTIRELPTLKTVHVNSSEIFYTSRSIPDHYDGKSIVAALADFRKNPEALLVVKHNEELYSLHNRELWMHQQISKIERRPPKITVHIKMEMDFNMLRFFTCNYMLSHFTTVKFEKSYHHSSLEKTFLDFLRREEDSDDIVDDDDDDDVDNDT